MSVGYEPYVYDPSQDYFTMVVTTGGGNVTWTGTFNNTLSYSIDGGTTWSEASKNITLTVNDGNKILWKGTTTATTDGIGKFSGDDNVRYSVEGNVMSLLFGDDFKGQTSLINKRTYTFYSLFLRNKNITSAKNLSLPATTLVNNCYYAMFRGCTNLTTAPELLATTLTESCYGSMFQECTSLTTAPELPATTLKLCCYMEMFRGCINLNSITCLATDISANYCTTDWVKDVATTGTFTKAASMSSWTTGTSGIPSGWTVVDA